MKNKRNLVHLVDEFLKSSPRSLAQKRGSILPPEYRQNLSKLPTDEQYLKNFIVHIDCSYMYNYYGPPTVLEHKMFLHKKSFVNPLSVGLVRRKAIQINDKGIDKKTVLFELIKGVNKDKHTVMRYTELQEFILRLSIEETRQYKKFIVYLYKWLLNEKHLFPSNSIQFELCQQTSQLIIKKIYSSHESGDYELLKNTEEELLTIENLEKAREFKRNGKFAEAKEIYEMVYFSRPTEQIDRLEALEYICQRCKEQQDNKFLEKMVDKIKEGLGLKSHQKTLKRAINEIIDLQTPLESVIEEHLQMEFPEPIQTANISQILLENEKSPSSIVQKRKKASLLRDTVDNGKNN